MLRVDWSAAAYKRNATIIMHTIERLYLDPVYTRRLWPAHDEYIDERTTYVNGALVTTDAL